MADPIQDQELVEKALKDPNQDPEQKAKDDFDRAALETATQKRLDAFNDDDDDTPSAADEDEEDRSDTDRAQDDSDEGVDDIHDKTVSDEDSDDADSDDSGTDVKDDDKDQQETADTEGQGQPADESPTLPAAYRRSLKAYGWTEEDIDSDLKSLGEGFVRTAERIHANRNAENAAHAAAGRQVRQQQQQQLSGAEQQPSGLQVPVDQAAAVPKPMQSIDVGKLKKDHGDDELIDAIVGPVNASIEAMNAILPLLQQGVQQQQETAGATLAGQVEKFFGTEELAAFVPLYGTTKDGKVITKEQYDQRDRVLETADALVSGAMMQNRDLSVEEALANAHDLVSVDFQRQAVRTDLKKATKKRNRGISMKPSSRGKTSADSETAPPTRAELIARTTRRLAALGL